MAVLFKLAAKIIKNCHTDIEKTKITRVLPILAFHHSDRSVQPLICQLRTFVGLLLCGVR